MAGRRAKEDPVIKYLSRYVWVVLAIMSVLVVALWISSSRWVYWTIWCFMGTVVLTWALIIAIEYNQKRSYRFQRELRIGEKNAIPPLVEGLRFTDPEAAPEDLGLRRTSWGGLVARSEWRSAGGNGPAHSRNNPALSREDYTEVIPAVQDSFTPAVLSEGATSGIGDHTGRESARRTGTDTPAEGIAGGPHHGDELGSGWGWGSSGGGRDLGLGLDGVLDDRGSSGPEFEDRGSYPEGAETMVDLPAVIDDDWDANSGQGDHGYRDDQAHPPAES